MEEMMLLKCSLLVRLLVRSIVLIETSEPKHALECQQRKKRKKTVNIVIRKISKKKNENKEHSCYK